MNGILIFDEKNDVVYTKFNKKFVKHMKQLAESQGFIAQDEPATHLNSDVIIQIFSPIVTSQRIMSSQFGNSYTCLQCQNGFNIVIDEYMGYLFLLAGHQSIEWLHRALGVCVTIVRHICAADVHLLKSSESAEKLLSTVYDSWTELYKSDQSLLVECTEQLLVNTELSTATLLALQKATEHMPKAGHALAFVGNKFLSLYSSPNAQELSAKDILFLGIFSRAQCQTGKHIAESGESEESDTEEFYSVQSTATAAVTESEVENNEIFSNLIFLSGSNSRLISIPHVIHTITLSDSVRLLLITEAYHYNISPSIFETFEAINKIKIIQLQSDMDSLKPQFDLLDLGFKHIGEGLKKCKIHTAEIDNYNKRLQNKWDIMKKKYLEFFKTIDNDCMVKIESGMSGLTETLRELFHSACLNVTPLNKGQSQALEIAEEVKEMLSNFTGFLKVKALRNFTLGSRASLTINKYLEEFPGLVHFLYIDRSYNRLTAPSLDFSSQETVSLTKEKIWSMVEFSRIYLSRGHFAIMWKDTIFNYAYFLWFEDSAGSPIKPKEMPTNQNILKPLPQPGIICGDFYKRLVETCFPKVPANKIRCYELYCIHLGLATASCVLEHSRRLAATIYEVTGAPANPLDLL